MSKKRRLSGDEEFSLMHSVFDKFLWIGTVFVGWGLWRILEGQSPLYSLLVGVVILVLFAWILVREFESFR